MTWIWDGMSRTTEACEILESRRIGYGNPMSLCITGNVKKLFSYSYTRVSFLYFSASQIMYFWNKNRHIFKIKIGIIWMGGGVTSFYKFILHSKKFLCQNITLKYKKWQLLYICKNLKYWKSKTQKYCTIIFI